MARDPWEGPARGGEVPSEPVLEPWEGRGRRPAGTQDGASSGARVEGRRGSGALR